MTPKQNEAISESLGLNPLPQAGKEVVPQQSAQDLTVARNDAAIEDDYNTARTNLRTLAEKADKIIDDLSDLAMDTENPKHFETLAALIKSATEANEKLLTIGKTRKETHKLAGRAGDPQEDTKQITVQNALFVGSTQELAKLIAIEKSRKKDVEVIDVQPDNTSS